MLTTCCNIISCCSRVPWSARDDATRASRPDAKTWPALSCVCRGSLKRLLEPTRGPIIARTRSQIKERGVPHAPLSRAIRLFVIFLEPKAIRCGFNAHHPTTLFAHISSKFLSYSSQFNRSPPWLGTSTPSQIGASARQRDTIRPVLLC